MEQVGYSNSYSCAITLIFTVLIVF